MCQNNFFFINSSLRMWSLNWCMSGFCYRSPFTIAYKRSFDSTKTFSNTLNTKMVSVIKTAILLFSLFCYGNGSLIRSAEHRNSQKNAMLFLDVMQENLIAEIRNFTATGYRSPLFDLWSKNVPYTEEMTRIEVDDYPLVWLTVVGHSFCLKFCYG